jgi:hypothetical protein
MKKVLILIFICLSIYLFGWEIDTSAEIFYDSNILNLSEDSLDEFKNNVNNEKYDIETSDDLITAFRLHVEKQNYLTGHTQNHRVLMKYNKYWQNPLKNNYYLGYEIQQFFSKKVNLKVAYYHFADIYLNNYTSNTENSDAYHHFTYDKNVWQAELFYKFAQHFSAEYKFQYSQLFHNKYFTDYDAEVWENGAEVRYYLPQKLRLRLAYNYKISEQEQLKLDYEDKVDPSYEADVYFLGIRIPLHYRDAYFYNRTTYEARFYSSKLEEDQYHIGRQDKKWKHESVVSFDLNKTIRAKFFYEVTRRYTDSYFDFVENDKQYESYEIGLSLTTTFQ